MDLGISERVAPLIKAVRDMVENDIAPLDAEYHALVGRTPQGIVSNIPIVSWKF